MAKAIPIEDEIAERVLHGLERVKLSEVADAGLKIGVEVTCVLGVKAVLDFIPLEEWLNWATAHPETAKTFMGSLAAFQISGSPLAVAPLFKEVVEDEETRDRLKNLILDSGLSSVFELERIFGDPLRQEAGAVLGKLNKLTNAMLGTIVLSRRAEVVEIIDVNYSKAANLQGALDYARQDLKDTEDRINAIPGEMQLIMDAHDPRETELLIPLKDESRRLTDSLPGKRDRVRVLEAQVADALSCASKAEEAVRRSVTLLKWAAAFIIGTYVAGSLIYAQDTIFDVVKEALGMFKIVPPVV